MVLCNRILAGNPIMSMQTMLRQIALYHNIPIIIPTGVFNDDTERAVIAFQNLFNLSPTGIVDNDVWDAIVLVFVDVTTKNRRKLPAFAGGESILIMPNDQDDRLYVIQHKLVLIAKYFNNITAPNVTGVHDSDSVNSVMQVQDLHNFDKNGIIDEATERIINYLYNVAVLQQ